MRYPFSKEPRKIRADDMRRACIPEEFWQVTFAKMPESKHKKYFEAFLNRLPEGSRKRMSLALLGRFGRGKSSMGVIAQKKVIAHCGSTLFVTSSDVIDYTINPKHFDVDMTFLNRMKNVDLLVIDDLGLEALADGANSCMEKLVRTRLGRRLSTIITSNLNRKDMEDRYPGLSHALLGSTIFLEINGKDWRQENQGSFARSIIGDM